jgi:hypothetical protein
VLVGREPDDPTAVTTAADLAALDPLPTRALAVEGLRAIAEPDGMPMLSGARLLQPAAAASHGAADVKRLVLGSALPGGHGRAAGAAACGWEPDRPAPHPSVRANEHLTGYSLKPASWRRCPAWRADR